MATLMMTPWLSSLGLGTRSPSASLIIHTGFRTSTGVSLNASFCSSTATADSRLLRSSFTPSSVCLFSSFSGLSLGFDMSSRVGISTNRRHRLVVKAGKAALCQTKRNRSRKSLARTHGFRLRMSTTSGRVVLKRRRAKCRKVLCTKSNPWNGKRS